MTIYEVKRIHQECFPLSHFFDRKTLHFFGQTLKMFHVKKEGKNYRITAPMRLAGHHIGITDRTFDPCTGELFHTIIS